MGDVIGIVVEGFRFMGEFAARFTIGIVQCVMREVVWC